MAWSDLSANGQMAGWPDGLCWTILSSEDDLGRGARGARLQVSVLDAKTDASDHAANILRIEGLAMPIGMFAMASVVSGVWWHFAGKADPLFLYGWLIYMASTILILVSANLFVAYRKPPVEDYVGFWGPLGKALNFAMVLGAIASIWILMPAADIALRHVLITVYMGFVITNLMIHAEGARALSTVTIFGVFGSLVVFLLLHPMQYDGAIIAFLVLMAVTMMKLQQIFRISTREAIAARVASERTRLQLDQALADVIAERDTKTRFLESASHDLRQPLQAARMFADQTERGLPEAQHAKAVNSLHWALDAADQSLTQILEHLRLEAGEVEPNSRVFSIGPLIAHMAELHEPHSRLSNSDIIALPTSLRMLADRALVERAIGNLIGNAIRHAHAGRILIGAKRHKGKVRIWVIDDGVGIPARDQNVIFDRYVQGSNHGDEIRGGFGLGLATVIRLAELMNGTAGLDKRWKNGSAFWLELPAGTD